MEKDETGVEKISLRKAEGSDGSVYLEEVGSETPRTWRLQKAVKHANLQNIKVSIGSKYWSAPYKLERLYEMNLSDLDGVKNDSSISLTGSVEDSSDERETFGIDEPILPDDRAFFAKKIPWNFTFWLDSMQIPEDDEDAYFYPITSVDARFDMFTVLSRANAIKLSFELPERELIRIIESLNTLDSKSIQLKILVEYWVRDTGGEEDERYRTPEDTIWGLGKAFLVGWEVGERLANRPPESTDTRSSAGDRHLSDSLEFRRFPQIPNELQDEVDSKVESAKAEGIRIRSRVLVGTTYVLMAIGLVMYLVGAPPSAYIVGSVIVGTLALVYTALTVSASANTQSDTLNAIVLFYGEQL